MRRVIKKADSEILKQELKYIQGNSANNKKIANILSVEQKKFCAYTDEYLTRTDAHDIEHFNPTLKGTTDDNYENWLLVKHQWNNEKSAKWEKYQPILQPTAIDFEERIVYDNGDYFANSNEDIEAKNLLELLKLDDAALSDERKRYIARKIEEIKAFGDDARTFFNTLLNANPCQVSYPRAIKEHFGVDILEG